MSFILFQWVFIACRYFETKSFKTVQNDFLVVFPEAENMPNKSTILRTVKWFKGVALTNE